MDTAKMLDEIREANLSYLLLARQMISGDREQALYRLGLSSQIADILMSLSTAQLLKIAGSSLLLCRIRSDDHLVWSLLGGYNERPDSDVGGIHASILMSRPVQLAAA